MEDFTRAVAEIKPAFGMSLDAIEQSMPNGILQSAPRPAPRAPRPAPRARRARTASAARAERGGGRYGPRFTELVETGGKFISQVAHRHVPRAV